MTFYIIVMDTEGIYISYLFDYDNPNDIKFIREIDFSKGYAVALVECYLYDPRVTQPTTYKALLTCLQTRQVTEAFEPLLGVVTLQHGKLYKPPQTEYMNVANIDWRAGTAVTFDKILGGEQLIFDVNTKIFLTLHFIRRTPVFLSEERPVYSGCQPWPDSLAQQIHRLVRDSEELLLAGNRADRY